MSIQSKYSVLNINSESESKLLNDNNEEVISQSSRSCSESDDEEKEIYEFRRIVNKKNMNQFNEYILNSVNEMSKYGKYILYKSIT